MNHNKSRFFIVLFALLFPVIFSVNSLNSPEQKAVKGARFISPGEVRIATSCIGLRKCLTEEEYQTSEGHWCSPMPDNIAYTTDYSVGYWMNITNAQHGEKYIWKYYLPNGDLFLDEYFLVTDDPSGEFPCCFICSFGGGYCSYCSMALMIGFEVRDNHYLGEWTVEVYRDSTLLCTDYFFLKSPVVITLPSQGDDFDVTEQLYIATPDIIFEVVFENDAVTPPIDWNLDLEYQTSGNKYYGTNSRSFSTNPNEQHNEFYASMGGQLTVNAVAAALEGFQVQAAPVIVTVTGVPIPDSTITQRLVDLYSGPTENLMTGLAAVESSYMQFSQRTLYDRYDRWPQESYDGGSHIGLMQVETNMERAWDWLENTRFGVELFNGKVQSAKRNVNEIRRLIRAQYGERLRTLNNEELENMALIYYGPYGVIPQGMTREEWLLTRQYYTPQQQPDGTWDWIVNSQGNPEGVQYVQGVRASMQS